MDNQAYLQIEKGSRSPWGKIQRVEFFTPWLCRVSTAGHGGMKLSREFNRLVPKEVRSKGGWYEEDCEWALVFFHLKDLIRRDCFGLMRNLADRLIHSASERVN